MHEVRNLLIRQGVDTLRVRDCGQAASALCFQTPPVLVFTATDLPDGTWEDVLKLSANVRAPVKVVVVSRVVDVSLYLDVLEGGGFDFVVPPFYPTEVAHIVRCATQGGPVGQDEDSLRDGLKSSPAIGTKKSKSNWVTSKLSDEPFTALGPV